MLVDRWGSALLVESYDISCDEQQQRKDVPLFEITLLSLLQVMELVARVTGASAKVVDIKSLMRVCEKVQSDYAGRAEDVCDMVRGAER